MTSYALGMSVRKLYNWAKPYVKSAVITPHFLAIRQLTSQNRRPSNVDLGYYAASNSALLRSVA